MANANGVPPITAPWPVKDIVYVAIVGSVMIGALLEWLLWLMAFLYCLFKVFQKADGEGKISIRILAILNVIFFVVLRLIFLPIMLVTLPLPAQVVQYLPEKMVSTMQWFAFWSFAALLMIPWLFCVYQVVTHTVGRSKRIKYVLDEHSAPKVVILMPCYNEKAEILLRTVDSLVDCEYPPSCLHVFLSFDGDQEGELYLNTLERLGVPLTLDTYPKSVDVTYRSCRITVSRFPHGGKRGCQKKTYRVIDKVYKEYLRRNDNLFLLFIDSDCILDKHCIQNFMYEMELKPGSKRNMLAMTGVITSTTDKHSLITVLQDMEYIHGQLFERSVESGCGAVTCLPGALTILRFSAFRKIAKYYFADKAEQCDDLFDYGKSHLGEDRWLTHLFMIGAQERYQIQMNTGAFCKTEAVQTFKSLLKQRRRWFLGFITNEVCMLTDIRLWKRYPLLLIIRLAQNTIRTTALLFFIMVISILTTSQAVANLPIGFIAVSLGLNWLLMMYFGFRLGRYKIMLYPLMFVVNPFFNWLYMVYGIFTAGQRTWGGPRADAGKADEKTTPEQVVQEACATGNDLNIVPETFRPAMGARRHAAHQAPLLPPHHLEGRFAPAEELPGGWYRQSNDSGFLHADMTPRFTDEPRYPRSRRASDDSLLTGTWTDNGVHTPRRVESLFEVENALIYQERQALQRPAGGAFYEADLERRISSYSNRPLDHPPTNSSYAESIHSEASGSSISLHFGISHRPRSGSRSWDGLERAPPSPDLLASNGPSDANSDPLPQAYIPTRPTTSNALTVPLSAYHPSHNRSLSHPIGVGRSPLARKSFTRNATDEEISAGRGETIEMEVRVPRRLSQNERRRGRRGRTSVDGQGRRRLSKARPQSSSASSTG